MRDVAYDEALPAMVARTIMPQEARKRDDCEKVVMEEYNKLRGKVWQEENVREWSSVVHEAKQEGREIHVGSLHELVVEKGSELPLGDKNRKLKGRVVFIGDRVRVERKSTQLLRSCPLPLRPCLRESLPMPTAVCQEMPFKQLMESKHIPKQK